jgi:glyoxylase-like metal-dependent hydrolase (beta-lactamase superfamily II)
MSTDGATQFLKMDFKASPAVALPVITFTRDAAFHLNGEDLSILHAPAAHTDGDAIVRFTKSNVIHMGDTFFNKLYPFIDYSSGGSAQGMIAAADRVLKITDDHTKIIPGHGPLGTKADLKIYRDMMATISKRVGDQVKTGNTLRQVLASKPTKEYDAQWGKGFLDPERFVTMLYEGMRKK